MRLLRDYWPLAWRIALTIILLASVSVSTPVFWVLIPLVFIWFWNR